MAAVYAPAYLHSVKRDADLHGLLVGKYQSHHQESLWACFMALQDRGSSDASATWSR